MTNWAGTNLNGIKIRYSRLRGEKQKLAEENGFKGLGEDRSKPGSSTAGTPKGKKRAAKGTGTDGDDLAASASPTKKGKKGGQVDTKEVKKEEDGPDDELLGDVKVEETEI